jgi:hypothetical protein
MRNTLLFCLLLLCLNVARAATVIGSIQDSFEVPYGGQVKTIEFNPLSTPQAIGTNTVWPVVVTKKVTNGVFSVNLVGGIYWAGLLGDDVASGGAKKTVKILVPPSDTNTYTFNQVAALATNLGTFSYTNQYYNFVGDGGGITNIQASNVVGIVTSNAITNNQADVTLTGTFSGPTANFGVVYGSHFEGDGSGISNIPSSSITGLVAGASTNTYTLLNVRDLGAVGDGTTDDTAAIQAAIYSTTNAGTAGEVFFPAGRYRITDTIRIPQNQLSAEQFASVGPTRLVGNGMGSSTLAFYITNKPGISFVSTNNGKGAVHFEIQRLSVEGPLARNWETGNSTIGIVGGYPPDANWPYQGVKLKIRDSAVLGWETALAATNVWDVIIDASEFLSNRLSGMMFSCVHSTSITSTRVAGQPSSALMTGTGIGFCGPTNLALNFGDSAQISMCRIDYCTNAIYNDELALTDVSGNYQYCVNYMVCPSKRRASDNNLWRPMNYVVSSMYCDDPSKPWTTNSPALITVDTYSAPTFYLMNPIGNVCGLAQFGRPHFNVVTTTNAGDNYTNFAAPMGIGGSQSTAVVFNGGTGRSSLPTLTPNAPTFAGPVTLTNNNRNYTALTLLQGGNGNASGAALAIGANSSDTKLSGPTNKIGQVVGYSFNNTNTLTPDVGLLGYAANSGFTHLNIGGAVNNYSVSAPQSVQFVTAPNAGGSGALRGGWGYDGGFTVGSEMDWSLKTGQLKASNLIASASLVVTNPTSGDTVLSAGPLGVSVGANYSITAIHAGDGSGLTSLNASGLVGTVPASSLPSVVSGDLFRTNAANFLNWKNGNLTNSGIVKCSLLYAANVYGSVLQPYYRGYYSGGMYLEAGSGSTDGNGNQLAFYTGADNQASIFRRLTIKTNGNVEVQQMIICTNGLSTARTNAYTVAELGLNGFGMWNSNGSGTLYWSINQGGSVSNKLAAP